MNENENGGVDSDTQGSPSGFRNPQRRDVAQRAESRDPVTPNGITVEVRPQVGAAPTHFLLVTSTGAER